VVAADELQEVVLLLSAVSPLADVDRMRFDAWELVYIQQQEA